MLIVKNKYFPRSPFIATNVFGIILFRIDKGEPDPITINHEFIHILQQKELWFIGFLVCYYWEWMKNYMKYKNVMKAYYEISFEKEAYTYEKDLEYSHKREAYAWRKF